MRRSVLAVGWEPDGPDTFSVSVTGAQIPKGIAKNLVERLEHTLREWTKEVGGVCQETHFAGESKQTLQQVDQSYIGDPAKFKELDEKFRKEKAN